MIMLFNIMSFVIGAWVGGIVTAVAIAIVSMNQTDERDHGR